MEGNCKVDIKPYLFKLKIVTLTCIINICLSSLVHGTTPTVTPTPHIGNYYEDFENWEIVKYWTSEGLWHWVASNDSVYVVE